MRGYHIRIVVKSQTHTNSTSIPTDIFTSPLPSHSTPKTLHRRNATSNFKNKDYRFGPLRIDWADIIKDQDLLSEVSSSPRASMKRRENPQGHATAKYVSLPEHTSGTTNLPEGIVHVYRDVPPPDDAPPGLAIPVDDALKTVVLGILAVPGWMTPSDLLTFVAPAAEGISHVRIIRDSLPNRSFGLIEFPKMEDAVEFIEAYNGKPFNSLESEICNIVRIRSVKIMTTDAAHQAFTPLPDATMYELPTCPVCLERLDSAVTGLITVPCSHTFHCSCLSKWGDSRCPVCRYSQSLKSSHPTRSNSSGSTIPFSNPTLGGAPASTCATCASPNNLWICLVCGHVGCGRYGRAHAQQHYELTTHLYALELETQRVWDYAGDGYVHRLIQNRADGKLVELPSAASNMSLGPSVRDGGVGPGPADALAAEKMEAIGIEYSYLLTSQLDSQRSYYEEQVGGLEGRLTELSGVVERLERELKERRKVDEDVDLEKRQREKEEMEVLAREKAKADARLVKMTEMARRLDKELKEERAVSAGLMKNLTLAKEKNSAREQEQEEWKGKVQDLEDQLRDVMFFLEANAKIEQGGGAASEAAGGSIEMPPPPPPPVPKTGGRKRGKK